MQLSIRAALSALVVGLAFVASCSRTTTYVQPPRPVRVHEIEPLGDGGAVRYSANIKPRQEVALSFRTGGYVDQLLVRRGADGRVRAVQEGDRVARGTVLAQVRQSDYQERMNQATSQLREAQAFAELAGLALDRAQRLFERRSLTRADLDGAKAQAETAGARVQGAEALIAEARIALEDTKIVAPWDALVLERDVEIGELVGPGKVVVRLADVGTVKAVFGAPDMVVERLALGTELPVSSEALRGTALIGRVTAVAPFADPNSRVFDVELSIANPEGRLKPGMIVTVSLARTGGDGLKPVAPVPGVPLRAVVRPTDRSEGYAVYVVDPASQPQVARMRVVELGDVHGNRVSVVSGLAVGERVVVTGATLLADGDEVRVIPGTER